MGTLQDLTINRYSLITELSEVKELPKVIEQPKIVKAPIPPRNIEGAKVKASRAVTIILDKDNSVYYYAGTRDEKGNDPFVTKTDFSPSGIRKTLIEKNHDIMAKVEDLRKKKEDKKLSDEDFVKQRTEIMSDKTGPIVIIKATNAASYGNLIDILDEMAYCNIGRYAIVDIADFDKNLISKVLNPPAFSVKAK